MKQPKMILFDYGQTLVSETLFDGVKGSQAVLNHVRCNPHQVDGAGLHALADQLNREIGQDHLGSRYLMTTEIPNMYSESPIRGSLRLPAEKRPCPLVTFGTVEMTCAAISRAPRLAGSTRSGIPAHCSRPRSRLPARILPSAAGRN